MTNAQDTTYGLKLLTAEDLDRSKGWNEEVDNRLTQYRYILRDITADIHSLNLRWWKNLYTNETLFRNRGEMLMLMVSELSEAMEGERKNLQDKHLPYRRAAEVELADCIIRILDYAGGLGYDIAGALIDKLIYNASREDHTAAARSQDGGKKW